MLHLRLLSIRKSLEIGADWLISPLDTRFGLIALVLWLYTLSMTRPQFIGLRGPLEQGLDSKTAPFADKSAKCNEFEHLENRFSA